MTQKNRLDGGLIDRTKKISFTFDGQDYDGYEGDTLASALLANNVRLMGRSFKYHRPRGAISAGSEEPNALVELREDDRMEPNTRATTTKIFDGLVAKSQNRFPSLKYDFMAINDVFSKFLTAGFYYKTFMWPKAFWEKLYEPIIRKAAGLGSLSMKTDPDEYDKGFLHCDLLITGAGPSGLFAALTAGKAGARVILVDEDFVLGGRLNFETFQIGDDNCDVWAQKIVKELNALSNVTLMPNTTTIGAFDHGVVGALERVNDYKLVPETNKPRQILWRIYSKQHLVCTGAIERPIAFANNDRPGIMLAGAMRAYANRWTTTIGQEVAIFTNNDDAYKTATDLLKKGVTVKAVIDIRENTPDIENVDVIKNAQVINTKGRLGLSEIHVRLSNGDMRVIKCQALGVSGGWNPNLGLTSHQGARPVWRDDIAAFVPAEKLPVGQLVAGAASGLMSTHEALSSGNKMAVEALKRLGIKAKVISPKKSNDGSAGIEPFWQVAEGKGRAWVDFQNDVTIKDIKLAHQENFKSVEHLKRYTTLGMATDQGKTSNLGGLAVMAELTGKSIQETGTTMFRPPYVPVAIAAFAGRSRGAHFRPVRKTPSHFWAEEQGAVFVEVGNWLRAQWFPKDGETHWRQSVDREVLATRKSVGVCDVTTLGKIDVQGTDAATFLNYIYCNPFAKLAVGKTRYGLMLREDGIAMDDGTAGRLAEDHFVVTTTTANAVNVYRHMEFCRQCLWPDLDVQIISTTEAWAQYAVAGPNSRKVLQKIVDPEFDISNEAFPFMACGEITVCGGLRARLFRISFSGELAFEIAVPTRYGDALIREIIAQGEEFDITPYGTEALGVMRIEKGHAAGNELNGTTTALNLGMERMVSKKKDSIGSVLSEREGLVQEDAYKLVGFKPIDQKQTVKAGMHLMNKGDAPSAKVDQGYMTSAAYSPSVQSSISIGFLKQGDARMGEVLQAVNPLQNESCDVEVVSAHFVDPDGERVHA